jgi:formylglycine-generating enzyme required for sulfatase activity
MAGNVDEWTTDIWQFHPGAKEPFTDDDRRVVKGGYYLGASANVRCGARYGGDVGFDDIDVGIRIVVAPLLAHVS